MPQALEIKALGGLDTVRDGITASLPASPARDIVMFEPRSAAVGIVELREALAGDAETMPQARPPSGPALDFCNQEPCP